MQIRRAVVASVSSLTLAVALLSPAMPASAEALFDGGAPTGRSASAPSGVEEHCALDLDVAASAEDLGLEAPEPVCFASIEEVERYLERRSVAAADSRLTAATATASIGVGRIYQDANKGGSSLTLWGSSGCSGVSFGFPSLSSAWSSSVSSLTGLNGCWATAYATTYYGGIRANCTPYCATLGSLNDRVKSIVFRPVGSIG